MNPHYEPKSPGVRPRIPMPSQPLDSNPPMPAPACITNEILWDEVQILKGTTREILVALKGNDYGTKGVIPRLDEIEVKQEAQDRKLIKWAGMAAGAGLVLSVLKDWVFPVHK